MITRKSLAEANLILARLEQWGKARSEAETIAHGDAYGPRGAGLKIALSENICHMIRRERLAECDREIAAWKRRAAQINLEL